MAWPTFRGHAGKKTREERSEPDSEEETRGEEGTSLLKTFLPIKGGLEFCRLKKLPGFRQEHIRKKGLLRGRKGRGGGLQLKGQVSGGETK